ncbi:MAG: response regulator [Bacteroidales bacterium]|nr:response regulator [Bacteroidales bacterium]
MATLLPRVIIVDDHGLFRESIKLLIEEENIGKVIGEAENGQEFLKIINNEEPDIVIMDVDMPVMNGLEATEKALAKFPNLKILVLSMHSDINNYTNFIEAGVKGFIQKTSGKKEFESAIEKVVNGESYFSNELLCKIISHKGKEKLMHNICRKEFELTDREIEIMEYFCKGFSAKEIAEKLFLSIKTIDSHRSKLLSKTNNKNTTNLVLFAIKNKLVTV